MLPVVVVVLIVVGLGLQGTHSFELKKNVQHRIENAILTSEGKADAFSTLKDIDFELTGIPRGVFGPLKFVQEMKNSLDDLFYHDVHIAVHLVGFQDSPIEVKETLRYYLQSVPEEWVRLVQSDEGRDYIPIRKHYDYQVVHADVSLGNAINANFKKYLTSSGETQRIPIDIVDSIIYEYYSRSYTNTEYQLYIINTGYPPNSYIYTQRGTSCTTPMDVGHAGRYLWIDLSAGPMSWGHSSQGPTISTSNLPHPYHIPSKPSSLTNRSNPHDPNLSNLVVSLADLVRKTSHSMFVPPMDHFKVSFARERTILLVVIRDQRDHEQDEILKWRRLTRELNKLPLNVLNQTMKMEYRELYFEDCVACISLWERSLRSFAVGTYNSQPIVKRYLDSAVTINLISQNYATEILGDYSEQFKEKKGIDVYPVILFDIHEEDLVLIDKKNQAVGLPEMSIAVQLYSEFPLPLKDIVCGNQNVTFDATDATKPILNSILKGLWGVSPVLDVYDAAAHSDQNPYLWSLHEYPFKRFTLQDEENEQWLSFRERDAVLRHQVYYEMVVALGDLNRFISKLDSFKSELSHLMSRHETIQLYERLCVIKFKLSRSKMYLTQHSYLNALFYLNNLGYDLGYMKDLLDQLGTDYRFKSVLTCNDKDATIKWSRMISFASFCFLFLLFCVYILRSHFNKSD